MRGSRSKRILLVAIVIGSVLTLAAATRIWVEIDLFAGAAAFDELSVTGQQLNPSISPIAIAALASALVLAIAGPVLRRVLGAVVLLLGAGIALLGANAQLDPRGGVEWVVAEATGLAGDAQYALVSGLSTTPWPVLTCVYGGAIALAGVLVLLLGGGWRAAGRKYQSRPDRGDAAAAGGAPDRIGEWDALSEGQDPSDPRP